MLNLIEGLRQAHTFLAGAIQKLSNRVDWTYYVINWSVAPSQVGTSTISGNDGVVFSYEQDGVTRYRFVPNTYSPALDSFYKTYSGGVLSGLICTRGK